MNKCHTNFASSYKSMCQMCFQCTILMHETYELCTISIIKSRDAKFVNFFGMHYLKFVNMLQQMKKITKAWNMCL
jgi:hypothetical protein